MASWQDPRTERPDPGTARLICIPSAGNGDVQFDRWPAAVGPWRPVRLPAAVATGEARGLPERAAEIADGLADAGAGRFGVFGHEGAALLAYLVAVELDRRGAPAPLRLFLSGCPAPGLLHRYADRMYPPRADDALAGHVLAAAVALGAIPLPSVVASGVRAVRAERAAVRAFPASGPVPLRCPVTAIRWQDHAVGVDALAGWSAYGDAELVSLPGDRLSYATAPGDLLRVVGARAAADMRRPAGR